MTLRELLLKVDEARFHDCPLFHELKSVRPEYGAGRAIEVSCADSSLRVTNVHVGSPGDIVASRIVVRSDSQITDEQLLDAILEEMSQVGFSEADSDEFWDDMMDLRKARVVR